MKRFFTDEGGIATILVVILSVLGVIVVGVVVAGVVILPNGLSITVDNQSCGTLDVAAGTAALGFNFLPGINVPSEIAEGETAIVQVPRQFIDSVYIESGRVEVYAFNRSFSFGTSSIDMQRSTWNGTALSSLVGTEVEIDGEHTLVLECR